MKKTKKTMTRAIKLYELTAIIGDRAYAFGPDTRQAITDHKRHIREAVAGCMKITYIERGLTR